MLIGLDDNRTWSQPLYLPRTAFAIEGLCLYRDSARNDFVFLLGEEGVGEQWLVGSQGRLLGEARRVRGLSLPPQSTFCQTDDMAGQLYVNERTSASGATRRMPRRRCSVSRSIWSSRSAR